MIFFFGLIFSHNSSNTVNPGKDITSILLILPLMYFSPDRSYCVCGPSISGVGNDEFYETKSSFGVQVVQVYLTFQQDLHLLFVHPLCYNNSSLCCVF